MKELIQQQQNLNRTKFINNLILYVHSYILPGLSAALAVMFYDVNQVLFLTGLIILAYSLSIGLLLVVPFVNSQVYDLIKKSIEIEDNLKRIEKVHQSLDALRDSMLFDEDLKYWKILEKLDLQNS